MIAGEEVLPGTIIILLNSYNEVRYSMRLGTVWTIDIHTLSCESLNALVVFH